MKIFRMIRTILILSLFLILCVSCNPVSDDTANTSIPELTYIQLASSNAATALERTDIWATPKGLTYDGTGIYRLHGTQIIHIPADGSPNVEINVDVPHIRNLESGLAVSDEKIYIMTNNMPEPGTGEVPVYKELLVLDKSGAVLQTYELPDMTGYDHPASDFVVINDTVFIVSADSSLMGSVFQYNMATATMHKLDFSMVDSIAAMDGKLLVCASAGESISSKISVYDYTSNKVEADYIIHDNWIEALSYDAFTSLIYGVKDNKLFSYDLANDIYTYLYLFPATSVYGEDRIEYIAAFNNKLATMQGDGNIRQITNANGDWNQGETLTIYCNSIASTQRWSSSKAYAAFLEEHPLLRLEYIEITDYQAYESGLAKKLMANDTDFDLFVLDANMSSVLDKSYFTDLSVYENIADNFNKMLPGYRELFSVNNAIYGVPIFFDADAYVYNSERLDFYGIEQPTLVPTLSEYLGIFSNAKEQFQTDGVSAGHLLFHRFFGSLVASFFAGNDVQLSDISGFLESMLAVNNAGGMASPNTYGNGLFQESMLCNYTRTDRLMMSPVYKENAKLAVSVISLCVNVNSKNKELAAEYLAMLTSPEIETAFLDEYIPMLDVLYSHSHDEIEIDEAHIKTDLLAAEEIAQYQYLYERDTMQENENYQIYKEVISNASRRYYNGDIYVFAMQAFERLANNEISLEKAAENVYSKMLMVRDE